MSKDINKKRENRGRIRSFLRDSVSLPSDAFAANFGIEMRGRGLLFMQGCRSIVKYSTTEMILAAKGFLVNIRGERLECTTYHGGTVTVEGRIDAIDFSKEEEKTE
jgi:sporulation protein YqfC